MTTKELLRWHGKIARRDTRFRFFRWLLGLLLAIRLWGLFESWKGQPDTIDVHLLLLAIAGSLALVSHSALSTLKTAFSGPAIHRLSLPLSPARLLRVALSEIAGDLALWAKMLAIAATLSIVALGWRAAIWWIVVLTGIPFWIWLGFTAGLVLVRSAWAPLTLVAGSAGLWWVWPAGWSMADLPASPGDGLVAAALSGLASFLVVGPLAGHCGRLYQTALHSGQKQISRNSILQRAAALAKPLRHWNSPTGALLRRGILLQSRSSFTWMRLVGTAAALSFFPRLVDPATRPLLARPWSAGFMVASVVWLLFVVDGATSPIGAEGPRLQLYLASPLPISALLRAKMSAYLMAVGFVNLGALLFLAWMAPPDFVSWPEALAMLFLLTLGLTPIYVLGSCLEANPHRPFPSGLEGRLFEEAPITGTRLALVSVGAAYLALCFLAFQSLGLGTALALVLLADAGLFFALWRPARDKLIRCGVVPTKSKKAVRGTESTPYEGRN